VLDRRGEILNGWPHNERSDLAKLASAYLGALVIMEAGLHSPWISRFLDSLGMNVVVAKPRKTRTIWQSERKSDERVSSSELNWGLRVGAQEVFDGFGFRSRKIVRDDMDGNFGRLSGDQLAEKLDKFSAGVAVGGLAEDFARSRPHREKGCHGESIQIRDVRPAREKGPRPDPGGPGLKWRSFHRHRTPPHGPEA
jgi:hypothetical protein